MSTSSDSNERKAKDLFPSCRSWSYLSRWRSDLASRTTRMLLPSKLFFSGTGLTGGTFYRLSFSVFHVLIWWLRKLVWICPRVRWWLEDPFRRTLVGSVKYKKIGILSPLFFRTHFLQLCITFCEISNHSSKALSDLQFLTIACCLREICKKKLHRSS